MFCKYDFDIMCVFNSKAFWKYNPKKEVMEKWIFGKPTEYKFENIVVNGVENYEEFLTHIYGDWRKLPPEEKRKTAHEYIEIDLNKSYMA